MRTSRASLFSSSSFGSPSSSCAPVLLLPCAALGESKGASGGVRGGLGSEPCAPWPMSSSTLPAAALAASVSATPWSRLGKSKMASPPRTPVLATPGPPVLANEEEWCDGMGGVAQSDGRCSRTHSIARKSRQTAALVTAGTDTVNGAWASREYGAAVVVC